ncbi:MAG: hypothetical protein ACR2IP_08300 [Solirubrobacteraceae bacterium]
MATVGGAFTASAGLGSRDAFTVGTLVALLLAGLTAAAAATLRRAARQAASADSESTDARTLP